MIIDPKAVLEKLMEDPEIAQKVKALNKVIDSTIARNLINYTHSLLCTRDHIDGDCTYYEDRQLADCWLTESHNVWVDIVTRLMEENNVVLEQGNPSLTRIQNKIRQLADTITFVDSLSEYEHALFNSLRKIRTYSV